MDEHREKYMPVRYRMRTVPQKNEMSKNGFFKKADKRQIRAGKNIAIFLAVMIILTIVARGAAGATLAVVNVATTNKAEITDAVTGTAVALSDESVDIKLPEGLTVIESYAGIGESVKINDPILKFDLTELEEKIATLKNDIKQKQLSYDELLDSTSHNSSGVTRAQKALDWANDDYAAAKKSQQGLVDDASNRLSDAKKALKDAENALANYVPPVPQEAAEDEQPEEDTQSALPDKTQELKAAVDEMKLAVDSAAAALDTAKQQQTEALKAAERAIYSAQIDLQEAQKSDADSEKTEENTKNKNSAEAELVKMDIDKSKKSLEKYEALLAAGGIVNSTEDGIIKQTPDIGEKSSESTLIRIGKTTGEYAAEMPVKRDKAEKISIGTKVEVIYNTGQMYGNQVLEGTVTSLSEPDENDMVKVRFKLPSAEWKQNQSIESRIIIGSEVYPDTLPVSAVRSDNAGQFVLAAREKNTILGAEIVLYRIPVTVKATDAQAAAVEGALYGENIVTSSTKPVSDGSSVRILYE